MTLERCPDCLWADLVSEERGRVGDLLVEQCAGCRALGVVYRAWLRPVVRFLPDGSAELDEGVKPPAGWLESPAGRRATQEAEQLSQEELVALLVGSESRG